MIISIVTYNSHTVFECLDFLIKENKYRIKIFDNGSNAEYIEKLLKYKNNVEIHLNGENLGFGAAHNKNLENENSEYVIIFNPDVKATYEQINELKQYMDNNEDVVMITPKILNTDGTQQYLIRDKLTLFDFFLRRQPFSILRDKVFKNRLDKFECKGLSNGRVSEINISSGCFMFIRLNIFKKIGGFDDRFFMYFEDYDLCNRLRQYGKIVYYPYVEITHFYERGSHKSKHLFKIFIQSMIKYFKKWGWRIF